MKEKYSITVQVPNKIESGHLFKVLDVGHVKTAAKTLSATAFRLFVLLSLNQEGYPEYDPATRFRDCGYNNYASFERDFQELRNKGYIYEVNMSDTLYGIYDVPQEKEDIVWTDKMLYERYQVLQSYQALAKEANMAKSTVYDKVGKYKSNLNKQNDISPVSTTKKTTPDTPTETEEERRARLFGFGGDGY